MAFACSPHTGRLYVQSDGTAAPSPESLINSIRQKNQSIKRCKGIGAVKLVHEGQTRIDERMAWAILFPDKMRIEIRSISGVSLASFAYNGERLYISIPSEGRFIEQKTRNAKLSKLIAIPLRAQDLMQIIAGRLPIRKYNKLQIQEGEGGQPYTLILRNRWNTVIQEIYLDETFQHVNGFAIFNQNGSKEYHAFFETMQSVGEYYVPSQVKIANRKGDTLQIDVDRHWLNIPIAPTLFRLTPPIQHQEASIQRQDTDG
jgi:hypothetical protein